MLWLQFLNLKKQSICKINLQMLCDLYLYNLLAYKLCALLKSKNTLTNIRTSL